MAKSMLGKARTAAQKAAIKKWQAAGAAKRKMSGRGNDAISKQWRQKRRIQKILSGSEKKMSAAYKGTTLGAATTSRDKRQQHITRVIHSTMVRAHQGKSFKRTRVGSYTRGWKPIIK